MLFSHRAQPPYRECVRSVEGRGREQEEMKMQIEEYNVRQGIPELHRLVQMIQKFEDRHLSISLLI